MPPVFDRSALGHTFRDAALLRQALTHRSAGGESNERLEFLGDAVLACVIGSALFERFPDLPEGDLTRLRAHFVRGETLARLALQHHLGDVLRHGGAVAAPGPAMVADALEAIFGAIFVDAGYDAARDAVLSVYADEIRFANPQEVLSGDAKSRLQEWLQARRLAVPSYEIVKVRGEGHAQTFEVLCRIVALGIESRGEGPTRRAAEQAAAAEAYGRVPA